MLGFKRKKQQSLRTAQQADVSPDQLLSEADRQIEEQAQQLLDRPAFSYDPREDPLYGYLQQQYTRQGRLAMLDAVGQAANLTGGYASSYGQQAGQQAYQGYLQQLAELLPQLRQEARQSYDDETQRLLEAYQLAVDRADRAYDRRQQAQEQTQQAQEQADREQQAQYDRLQDRQKALVELISSTGYRPDDRELSEAGLTRAQADAWLGYYTKKKR